MELKIGNTVVGEIRENTYITYRKPEHFFKLFQGFGISTSVLEELICQDISDIVIVYLGEENRRFKSCVRDFYKKGNVYTHDHDRQFILATEHMEES